MKSNLFYKEKPPKKKGEFLEKKRSNQRRAKIYSSLKEACTKAMETGEAIVLIDNKKFTLSQHPVMNGYHFYAFVRMKRLGIVLAEICEKDSGWMDIQYPFYKHISGINSFVWENIAAYISKIEMISESTDDKFKKVETYIKIDTEHAAKLPQYREGKLISS